MTFVSATFSRFALVPNPGTPISVIPRYVLPLTLYSYTISGWNARRPSTREERIVASAVGHCLIVIKNSISALSEITVHPPPATKTIQTMRTGVFNNTDGRKCFVRRKTVSARTATADNVIKLILNENLFSLKLGFSFFDKGFSPFFHVLARKN